MAQTIHKYPLEISGLQKVNLRQDAVILCVQAQRDTLCLWALVDPFDPFTPRTIEIVGTGHPLDGAQRRYIGTALMDGGALVWHVFERL